MASKFWVLSNEDSRAPFFRANHAKNNQGSWEKKRSGWFWVESTIKPKKVVQNKKDPVVAKATEPVKKKRSFLKKILED